MKVNVAKFIIAVCIIFALPAAAFSASGATLLKTNAQGLIPDANDADAVGITPDYFNEDGYPVFVGTLPGALLYRYTNTDTHNLDEKTFGQFLDVNADGLPDFVVSYYEQWPNNGPLQYYKATFINSGNNEWIMVGCATNTTWFGGVFPQCVGIHKQAKQAKKKKSCVSEYVKDAHGRLTCKNGLDQTVFKTLPVVNNWDNDIGNGNIGFTTLGEFVDINSDGYPDFIISYGDNRVQAGYVYYRATFINNGGEGWIMQACESSVNFVRFAPCQ